MPDGLPHPRSSICNPDHSNYHAIIKIWVPDKSQDKGTQALFSNLNWRKTI